MYNNRNKFVVKELGRHSNKKILDETAYELMKQSGISTDKAITHVEHLKKGIKYQKGCKVCEA